jgi:hypothetical protein
MKGGVQHQTLMACLLAVTAAGADASVGGQTSCGAVAMFEAKGAH